MSIIAAQMQLVRRRWLSMMMMMQKETGGAPRGVVCRSSSGYPSAERLADTHLPGNTEIREKGLLKRPPGASSASPGEYMHQRTRFSWDFFVSKEIVPLYPLFLMVGSAITLGLVTMYREVAKDPTVIVSKKKRHNMVIPEIDENAEVLAEQTRRYLESSPLRKIALGRSITKMDEST